MPSIGSRDKYLRLHECANLYVCPGCDDHNVNVLEDGSMRCVATGETFEASKESGDLFAMREEYERDILALAVRSGQQWSTIIEMPQPERQALATSFELVDLFHLNRGGNESVTTVAVVPAKNRDETVVADAVKLLVSKGWEVFPARVESKCDQRTLWLKRFNHQTVQKATR